MESIRSGMVTNCYADECTEGSTMDRDDEPIFQTTDQALFISYLFCSLPASPKSPLFVAQEMVQDGDIEPARVSGIRFGEKVSPLQVRGDCAKVIAHVERTLKVDAELDAIVAKYGHGDERVEAMARMRERLRRRLGVPKRAMTRIIARHYGSVATRKMLSDYAIAAAVGGISHDSIRDARREAKKIIFGNEENGIIKVSRVLVAAGFSAR